MAKASSSVINSTNLKGGSSPGLQSPVADGGSNHNLLSQALESHMCIDYIITPWNFTLKVTMWGFYILSTQSDRNMQHMYSLAHWLRENNKA